MLSNRQILSVLVYNFNKAKLALSESTNLITHKSLIFWEKVRVSIRTNTKSKTKNVIQSGEIYKKCSYRDKHIKESEAQVCGKLK